MQSLGTIKVEFAVEVKRAKRIEDREMTHFDNYMKNEARVFQNKNEIRGKVMEFMDEVSSEINDSTRGSFIYFLADICTFLDLTLGIRFEPV